MTHVREEKIQSLLVRTTFESFILLQGKYMVYSTLVQGIYTTTSTVLVVTFDPWSPPVSVSSIDNGKAPCDCADGGETFPRKSRVRTSLFYRVYVQDTVPKAQ